jgi:hypothetical protein
MSGNEHSAGMVPACEKPDPRLGPLRAVPTPPNNTAAVGAQRGCRTGRTTNSDTERAASS